MLSRFHLIPERHGQTDRQTICYINIARQYADARCLQNSFPFYDFMNVFPCILLFYVCSFVLQ